jgi:hypothetical protein
MPAIFPVNFLVVRERVIIKTVPGTKLDAALSQAVVAFEADDFSPSGRWGWSVLVQGFSSEITDPDELLMISAQPLQPWAFLEGAANRVLAIETTVIGGRQFGMRG